MLLYATSVTSNSPETARRRDLAWAEALAGLSRVAVTLSVRLRQIHELEQGEAPEPPTAEPNRPSGGGGQARPPRGGFGPRQQAVLVLRGLDKTLGLAATEVANAIGVTAPNAHKLLTGLERLGALERVANERPARWRRAIV